MQTRSSDEKAVCLSFRLSNSSFVTKRKKVVPTFLYRMKDYLP